MHLKPLQLSLMNRTIEKQLGKHQARLV